MLPNAAPGVAPVSPVGLDSDGIGATAAAGDLGALYLMHVDPLRDLPSRRMWRTALEQTDTVIAHADFLSEGLWEFADIVFPAESYAEKEGTVTHPDGRVQRLRPAIKRGPTRCAPSGTSSPTSPPASATTSTILQRPDGVGASSSRRSRSTPA